MLILLMAMLLPQVASAGPTLVARRPVAGAHNAPQELTELVMVYKYGGIREPPPPVFNISLVDSVTGVPLLLPNASSGFAVPAVDEDGGNLTEVHYALPVGILVYSHAYEVQAVSAGDHPVFLWRFSTEHEPEAKNSAAEEADVVELEVYGLGVFIADVTDIDLRKGVFGADMYVYLLRYYRKLQSPAEAREAMDSDRLCRDTGHAEKFRFLPHNHTKRLSLINARTPPSPRIVPELDTDGTNFDHWRIQAEWSFSPLLERYPFQKQQLPLAFELAGDSVTRHAPVLLCALQTFSGFAPELSSFDRSAAIVDGRSAASPLFRAHFDAGEHPRWPPMDRAFRGVSGSGSSFQFPPDPTVQRAPTRTTSRLRLLIEYEPPLGGAALGLGPPVFIALSGYITLFLPRERADARMAACTTALLAAVVQHSSMRGRIPSRTAVLTDADIFMMLCEAVILFAFLSAAIAACSSTMRKIADGDAPQQRRGICRCWCGGSGEVERCVERTMRRTGLLSPLLFLTFLLGNPHRAGIWCACAGLLCSALLFIELAGFPKEMRLRCCVPLRSRLRHGCYCCRSLQKGAPNAQHRYHQCSSMDDGGSAGGTAAAPAAVVPT